MIWRISQELMKTLRVNIKKIVKTQFERTLTERRTRRKRPDNPGTLLEQSTRPPSTGRPLGHTTGARSQHS